MSTSISCGDTTVGIELYNNAITNKLEMRIDTTEIADTQYGPDIRIILNDDYEDPIWDGDEG